TSEDERHELRASTSLFATERSLDRGRRCDSAGLLDSSHRHAEVLGTKNDSDTNRRTLLLEEVRDVARDLLLIAKLLREVLDGPSELAQSADAIFRDVPDVCGTEERHEMMCTEGVELDVGLDDHLIVAGVRKGRKLPVEVVLASVAVLVQN